MGVMKAWISIASLVVLAKLASSQGRWDVNEQCKGKQDGSDCAYLCLAMNCGPPYTKCYKQKCITVGWPPKAFCDGKPDGTPCNQKCGEKKCRQSTIDARRAYVKKL